MTEAHPWRTAPPGDYAVVGDPVAHSKSPAMHTAAYRALGLDLTYRAIHVPAGELGEALDHLRTLGYRGVNATVPHKEAALAWADAGSPQAVAAGTANTLHLPSRRATNTDAIGFKFSLAEFKTSPARTLILGAGGSAASVILGLKGWSAISIWNRNPDRAGRLLESLRTNVVAARTLMADDRTGRGLPHPDKVLHRDLAWLATVGIASTLDLAGYNMIVNATPASLKGERLPLDWSRSKLDVVAYDLAYDVADAPFLREAAEAGRRTKDGKDMLAAQGAHAIMWWGDPYFGASALPGIWHANRAPDAPEFSPNLLRTVMRGALD